MSTDDDLDDEDPSPGTTESSEPVKELESGDNPVGRLRGLLRDLNPFLDSLGRACCRIPGRSRNGRMSWPLDSEPVLSLVTYRYFNDHAQGLIPTRAELIQAITLIRGELWALCPGDVHSDPVSDATIRVIRRAVSTRGDFLGSASEALGLLNKIVRNEPELIKQGESLPTSPDQLGILLGRIGLVLREAGIVVSRPRRTDTKRLWAWERLVPADDAADTLDTGLVEGSGNTKPNGHKNIGNDDAEIAELHRHLMTVYSEGTPHDTNAA